MFAHKKSTVPLKEFQESVRDWYAEKSQQFISANYRNYVHEQDKQNSFELEMERLELDSEVAGKRKQLEMAERLRQYLVRKENITAAKSMQQPQHVPPKLVDFASGKHKQAMPSSSSIIGVTKSGTEPSTSRKNTWLRFEATPELVPENVLQESEFAGQEFENDQELSNQHLEGKATTTSTPIRFDGSQVPQFEFRPSSDDLGSPVISNLEQEVKEIKTGPTVFEFNKGAEMKNTLHKSELASQVPQFSFHVSTEPSIHCSRKEDSVSFESIKCETTNKELLVKQLQPSTFSAVSDFNKERITDDRVLQKSASPTPVSYKFNDKDEINQYSKWIHFYTSFHDQIAAEIEAFEKDTNMKKLRISLKKTLVDKINFSAKKKASNLDLAQVLSFFLELFDFKPVKDSNDEDLLLDKAHYGMQHFAMTTICYRYIDKVKWDADLIDSITMVMVSLCLKSTDFYKIFLAEILHFSTLMSMSLPKILDKVISFGNAPPEVSTHWLQTESAIFRLFYRAQFSLESAKKYTLEPAAQNVKGPELIKMLLVNVLSMEKPVLLASSFIISEIFANCIPNLRRTSKSFLSELKNVHIPQAERIMDFKWEPILEAICSKLDEKQQAILNSRHESLLCVLRESIQKISSS